MVPKLCTAQASPSERELGYGGDQASQEEGAQGMLCRLPPRRPKLNILYTQFRRLKIREHATDLICQNMLPARRVATRDCLRDIASSVCVVQSVQTTPNETCSRAPTAQSLLVRRAGLTCCKGLWWSVSLQDPHPAWEYESGCSNNQHAMYCMAPVDPLEQWLER